MISRISFASVVVLVVIMMTKTVILNASVSQHGHPKGAACQDCHLAGDATTAKNAYQLVSSEEQLCGSCHAESIRLSHPTGFSPNRKIPEAYPLDWKGDLTCSTCHTNHQGAPNLLRGSKVGKEFCNECHDNTFFTNMADGGTSIHRSAHIGKTEQQVMANLDSFSQHCLECHAEDSAGSNIYVDSNGVLRHSNRSMSHPIGIDYAQISGRPGYRRISDISESIIFPDGRLSCVSCHQGYSKEHGILVASNQKSALCFQCHAL